jgi:23S rRNA (guanosine2251-2'-O)-methyltransferase
VKNTSGARKGRPSSSAVRKGSKGKQVGSGGQGRQALEGKKPTPAAEDRPYHPAGKAKAARERLDSARGRAGNGPRAGSAVAGRGGQEAPRRRPKSSDDSEMVTGRNSVLEALRTRIPASTLYRRS